jgi:hypothetical protein
LATALTSGTTYDFKIEAKNEYGYSQYSSGVTLLAAYIPEIPTDVTTLIDGDRVKVSWTLASENGSPITEYKVYIKEIGTEVFTQESSDCDGTHSTVITNKFCHIDISTLIASFNLDGGDTIYAKVVAVNAYGETDYSAESNGAYFTRVPDSPINLVEDITQRASNKNGVTWSDGANSGGSPISSYRITVSEQGGVNTVIATGITNQSYLLLGLSLGTIYEVSIEAQNAEGYSAPSETLSFLHALPPEAPSAPTTTNSGTGVVIDWTPPNDNGAPMTSYRVFIL